MKKFYTLLLKLPFFKKRNFRVWSSLELIVTSYGIDYKLCKDEAHFQSVMGYSLEEWKKRTKEKTIVIFEDEIVCSPKGDILCKLCCIWDVKSHNARCIDRNTFITVREEKLESMSDLTEMFEECQRFILT